MKKISTIIAIAVIMIMTAAPCFAAGLNIESTVPEDGAKNTTKENLCVKIFFNNEVGNEESVEANKDAFRIVNNEGKEMPSLIYYNDKDPKYVLILADTTQIPTTGKNAIQDDTEYTCILDADFRDNDGNTLGEEKKISFTTMNQGRGMMVYMILMVGMMVAMMGFTIYQTKKDAEKQAAEANAQEETFNPYKEAKQSGKSVEQVIAEHEKKSGKSGGIMGMLGGSKDSSDSEPQGRDKNAKRDGEYYCVKKPQPISAAGSTYKTGRKAKAEAEAKKREAEKQARKAEGYNKKKSDKKDDSNNKKKKKGGRK